MKGVERMKGIGLLMIAFVFFSVYVYTLFATEYGLLLVKLTVVVIVGVICFIIGWIGITLTINEKEQQTNKSDQ
jgi:ABC-type bacteriocin/lantibiotic exporter with double-glycine peptidase domain